MREYYQPDDNTSNGQEEMKTISLTPLDRVNRNIKQASSKANNILDGKVEGFEQGDVSKFLATKEYNREEYSQAIKNFSVKKDIRSNINSYISENDDGTKTLVRDARWAVNPPIIAPESYQLLAINHSRAAIQVIEDSKNRGEVKEGDANKAIQKIHEKMIAFVNKVETDFKDFPAQDLSVEKQNDKDNKKSEISKLEKGLKEFNFFLADSAEKVGIEKAQKKIKVAKDFSNFDDENYHVATITAIGKDNIVEIEAMNLGLTDKQRKMFEAVNNCEVPSDGSKRMEVDGADMEWFNNQPRHIQDMIKNSADKILTEGKVIPTQLREEIPLLRNSYTKSTQVKTEDGKNFEEVHRLCHSGTLTIEVPASEESLYNSVKGVFVQSKESKTAENLANENIEQLKQFSDNGKVSLEIMTAPNNPTGVDAADRKLSNNPDKGVFRSITAFNFGRVWPGSRRLAGYKAIIEMVEKQQKKDRKSRDSEGYKALKEAKKMMYMTQIPLFGTIYQFVNNANQQIAEKMSEACHLLKKEGYNETPTPNISCASGKDRTQMTIIGATCERIAAFLGKKAEEVSLALGKTGSAQYLSGGNGGGTIGCYGQKPETASAARKNVFRRSCKYFGQRTADLNKFKTSEPSLEKGKELTITPQTKTKEKEVLNPMHQNTLTVEVDKKVNPVSKNSPTSVADKKFFNVGVSQVSQTSLKEALNQEIKSQNHLPNAKKSGKAGNVGRAF